MRTPLRLTAAAVLTAAMTMIAVPAFADPGPGNGTQEMSFMCGGQQITVLTRANNAQAEQNWAAAWIVGMGTALPVSFEFAAYDDTTNTTLLDQAVDHAPAHQNMQQMTCTGSETGTVGDLFGDFLPPGANSAEDHVTFTITVVAALPGGRSA
jgi:hypothetical protein